MNRIGRRTILAMLLIVALAVIFESARAMNIKAGRPNWRCVADPDQPA
jgi:hypothetical protein